MKILTWNIERLKRNKDQLILEKLSEIDADILILTETSSKINLGKEYSFISTKALPPDFDGINYRNGENRVTIWTKFRIIALHDTYDTYTSVCADIETPIGLLTVYGTIMGVFGGKGARFESDLQEQLADIEKISVRNNFCIAGDLNVTFSGYAYPSHKARLILTEKFNTLSLINTTASIEDSVDHIILSHNILNDREVKISTWNTVKELSDHIGICVTIIE